MAMTTINFVSTTSNAETDVTSLASSSGLVLDDAMTTIIMTTKSRLKRIMLQTRAKPVRQRDDWRATLVASIWRLFLDVPTEVSPTDASYVLLIKGNVGFLAIISWYFSRRFVTVACIC